MGPQNRSLQALVPGKGVSLAACLLALLASCTSERAFYLPESRVVGDSERLLTEPQAGSGTFRFYRETFYFLPDSVTGTGFAIEVDPSGLSSGAVLSIGEPEAPARAMCLFPPTFFAFDVSGTIELIDVRKHSIHARVRLHREGLPPDLFTSGSWSMDEEVEFEIQEQAEEVGG